MAETLASSHVFKRRIRRRSLGHNRVTTFAANHPLSGHLSKQCWTDILQKGLNHFGCLEQCANTYTSAPFCTHKPAPSGYHGCLSSIQTSWKCHKSLKKKTKLFREKRAISSCIKQKQTPRPSKKWNCPCFAKPRNCCMGPEKGFVRDYMQPAGQKKSVFACQTLWYEFRNKHGTWSTTTPWKTNIVYKTHTYI